MSEQRDKRWRLVLGADAPGTDDGIPLDGREMAMDRCLQSVYGSANDGDKDDRKRSGSLQGSSPYVARWLGEIRDCFPPGVVQVLQKDALDRLGLTRMLLEPELLATIQPDIHLVSRLLELKGLIPETARHAARQVVRTVTDDIERRLRDKLVMAVTGALRSTHRKRNTPMKDLDWNRTILVNLKHYQPEYKSIIAEKRIGFARKQSGLKRIILVIDQSGSMARSVVYSGVLGSVLASIRTIQTSVVAFDTSVADLSHLASDPVDLLFGIQLGGGTDIERALNYASSLVTDPAETVMVLLSDLFDGGNPHQTLARLKWLTDTGVRVISLLALEDTGAPAYDHEMASAVASLGICCFACTPDMFADMISTAISQNDLGAWAARIGVETARPLELEGYVGEAR